MTGNPQLSVRIDPQLLEAIKNKCKAEGVTLTEFCVYAFKAALADDDIITSYSPELEVRIAELLAPLQKRLEVLERSASGEFKA